MGKFFYSIFLSFFEAGFRVAAMFNAKAKAGYVGRKDIFLKIGGALEATALSEEQIKPKRIWMHCASLGEFEQGRPVLEAVSAAFPQHSIVLTFFSASGYEAMKNYPGANHIFYLPFDSKTGAAKLVAAIDPALVLWVKYEYWFYYLRELKKRHIPLLLVSGIFREDQPFFKWYGEIWKEMLTCFSHFFVQNESSKELLADIGIHGNVSVSGDTRFDRVIEIAENFEPLPVVTAFCNGARVIVAGSTWEDDEAELTHYVRANPAIKFIIAPHEVSAEKLKELKQTFPASVFYSELQDGPASNTIFNVLIIDNVGMLSRLYHYADICYVGGGFGAEGVHNVLEAAVYGKPVIYGPEFQKFAEAIDLVDCGAGITIQNAPELEKVLDELWTNPEMINAKGIAARNYVYEHKGASDQIIQYIQEKRLLTS